MFFLAYVSTALRPFRPAELVQLLEGARERNTGLGVTGMLLYHDGNFLQVLEGSETAVTQLFEKIAQDERHTGVLKICDGYISERQFADWSMAYREVKATEAGEIPGFSDFLRKPFSESDSTKRAGKCWRLLESFRKGLR